MCYDFFSIFLSTTGLIIGVIGLLGYYGEDFKCSAFGLITLVLGTWVNVPKPKPDFNLINDIEKLKKKFSVIKSKGSTIYDEEIGQMENPEESTIV